MVPFSTCSAASCVDQKNTLDGSFIINIAGNISASECVGCVHPFSIATHTHLAPICCKKLSQPSGARALLKNNKLFLLTPPHQFPKPIAQVFSSGDGWRVRERERGGERVTQSIGCVCVCGTLYVLILKQQIERSQIWVCKIFSKLFLAPTIRLLCSAKERLGIFRKESN